MFRQDVVKDNVNKFSTDYQNRQEQICERSKKSQGKRSDALEIGLPLSLFPRLFLGKA
jgi:hypothetical protein